MEPLEMTPQQYAKVVEDLECWGWSRHRYAGPLDMLFTKNGKTYDLSAADLTFPISVKLERIEREGLFVVGP